MNKKDEKKPPINWTWFEALMAILHGTICKIRFDLFIQIWRNGTHPTFTNRIIQILMQIVVAIWQFTRSG